MASTVYAASNEGHQLAALMGIVSDLRRCPSARKPRRSRLMGWKERGLENVGREESQGAKGGRCSTPYDTA
jgi:hypothetical protein